jgi:hypothetical protein
MQIKRAAKLNRIVAVQRQMRQLAEWQLTELQREEDDLQRKHEELVQQLNGSEPLYCLFVEAMSRRMTALNKEAAVVRKAKERQADYLQSETRRLKQAERMSEIAMAEERRLEEARLFDELMSDLGSVLTTGAKRNFHDS